MDRSNTLMLAMAAFDLKLQPSHTDDVYYVHRFGQKTDAIVTGQQVDAASTDSLKALLVFTALRDIEDAPTIAKVKRKSRAPAARKILHAKRANGSR